MEEEEKGIPKIRNLVVADYQDGKLVKRITRDSDVIKHLETWK